MAIRLHLRTVPPSLLLASHRKGANRSKACLTPRTTTTSDSRSSDRSEQTVHFLGIGGAGISALATIALSQGYSVSGSDLHRSSHLQRVEKNGAKCFVGHSARNVGASDSPASRLQDVGSQSVPDALVVSSAVQRDNVETAFAKEIGIPVYNRSRWLARVTRRRRVVAIAGTHGKTSTSAMLAFVLRDIGMDIGAVVGGAVRQFPDESNAVGGSGDIFVLEADEYDGAFLGLTPSLAVITNIEFDHPDMFATMEDVLVSYSRFVHRVKAGGIIVACGDDANIRALRENAADKVVVTYGFGEENMWRAVNIDTTSKGDTCFTVEYAGERVCELSLSSPGRYNVLNSMAVFLSSVILTGTRDTDFPSSPTAEIVSWCHKSEMTKRICSAMQNYEGVSRRLEHVGSVGACEIYDDYAHHPTAIRSVVEAMRQRYVNARLVLLFQPHTFSRLAALLHEFAESLRLADRIIITSVYDARGELKVLDTRGACGQALSRLVGGKSIYFDSWVDAQRQVLLEAQIQSRGRDVDDRHFVHSSPKAERNVRESSRTVFVTLGAGNSNEFSALLHSYLSECATGRRSGHNVDRERSVH